jgi:trigger factor
MEDTAVVLPESMVRAEIVGRLDAFGRGIGVDPASLVRMLSSRDGEIEANWRPSAERALRSNLIIEALIGERNVAVGDEELRQEMERISGDSGMSEEEMAERYRDERLEMTREMLTQRKMLDILLAENTVREGAAVSYLDLMGNKG